MSALYRTYRPKKFSEVVGQKHIVKTLQNAVVLGNPAHAYLFCGGRGLGKTTLARVLARSLNCPNVQNGEACLSCAICKEMDAGSFMDLVEVDAASNTGVDNVRSLIETIHFQPTSGSYKVYIIDEAHMLSKGAWNALLKTLEEPPAHTVFVLATTESSKVPATINSRAQRFDFNKFSDTEIIQQLQKVLDQEGKKASGAVLGLISRSALGGMRDALTLLDQVLSLGSNPDVTEVELLLGVTNISVIIELFGLIGSGSQAEIPKFFEKLTTRYFDLMQVNRDILEFLRQLVVCKLTKVLPQDHDSQSNKAIGDLVGIFSESELLYLMRQFLRSYKELAFAPSMELPLLVASLEAALKFSGKVVGSSAGVIQSSGPVKAETERRLDSSVLNIKPTQVLSSSILQKTEQTQADASVTLEDVQLVWGNVCGELKEINGPLATLVRNSPVLGVEKGMVLLGVKYLFHKEQLESTKNRQHVTTVLTKLLGKRVGLRAEFVAKETEEVAPEHALTEALRIFGGELVE